MRQKRSGYCLQFSGTVYKPNNFYFYRKDNNEKAFASFIFWESETVKFQ